MRSVRASLPRAGFLGAALSPLALVAACASGDLPARTLSDPANPSSREGVRFALPAAALDGAGDGGMDGHVHDHGHGDHGPTAGTTYTCPMHPEVVQDHPGTCPKCGMTLKVKQ